MNIYSELEERLKSGSARLSTSIVDGKIREEIDTDGTWASTLSYPIHLVLFGAGHIGKALAKLASWLGFSLTVVDDREEELNSSEFDGAERILADFTSLPEERLSAIPSPYYCIFTHGHRNDTDCLCFALSHHYAYVGMIGSKNKIQRCFEEAIGRGISKDKLKTVHSPIGLPINAVSPKEIALSIMGEIISVYRSDKRTVTVDPAMIKLLAESKDGVICRILESDGSSPGREGALILVEKDSIVGTIGGGALESAAIEEARKLKESKIMDFDLSQGQELGMVCGGKVKVLFSFPA